MARTAGRSADETRRMILDAAARLIGRYGTAVPVAQIADAAQVSKGGLLYHFPSKEDLLTGLAAELMEIGAWKKFGHDGSSSAGRSAFAGQGDRHSGTPCVDREVDSVLSADPVAPSRAWITLSGHRQVCPRWRGRDVRWS